MSRKQLLRLTALLTSLVLFLCLLPSMPKAAANEPQTGFITESGLQAAEFTSDADQEDGDNPLIATGSAITIKGILRAPAYHAITEGFTVTRHDLRIDGTDITDENLVVTPDSQFSFGVSLRQEEDFVLQENDQFTYHICTFPGLVIPPEELEPHQEFVTIAGEQCLALTWQLVQDQTTGSVDIVITGEEYAARGRNFYLNVSASLDLSSFAAGEQLEVEGRLITVTDPTTTDDTPTDPPTIQTGTVPDSSKSTVTVCASSQNGSLRYIENDETPRTTALWNIWYSAPLGDYEASASPENYQSAGPLILTDTLSEGMRFAADPFSQVYDPDNPNWNTLPEFSGLQQAMPFTILLPVHWYGASYTPSSDHLYNTYILGEEEVPTSIIYQSSSYPSKKDRVMFENMGNRVFGDIAEADLGRVDDDGYPLRFFDCANGTFEDDGTLTETLSSEDPACREEIISRVRSSAGMIYGIYMNDDGRQSIIINFGTLGSGSDTLSYRQTFVDTAQEVLNVKLAAAGTDEERERIAKTAEYLRASKVFSFCLVYATYVTEDGADDPILENQAIFSDGSNAYWEVPNPEVPKERTRITVLKTDDAGAALPGAKLAIYRGADASGKQLDQWESGSIPHGVTLTQGVYTLKELEAPQGFLPADPIVFRLEAEGVLTVRRDDGEGGYLWETADELNLVMVDVPSEPPTITITKTIDEQQPAWGDPTFLFEISNEEGQVWYQSITLDADGNVLTGETSFTVPPGTYTIRELPVLRYCPVSEDQVTVEAVSGEAAAVSFTNKIFRWDRTSHTVSVVNHIGS